MKRLRITLALALAAAGWYSFFNDSTPNAGISKIAERTQVVQPASAPQQLSTAPAAPVSKSPMAAKPAAGDPILLLQPRHTLIGGAHDGSPTALFGTQTWVPPPPPPVVAKPRPPPPPPPPTAPPLPFTYLGKQFDDGKWQVFLARGDQTFIAVEQMIIEGTYRVDAIVPPQLTFVYLPLQKMQTLHIGGAN